MASILQKDSELRLPNFTVISASAGSGKTHTLSLKLLQLLLSARIPNNSLQNVLAITFTKNAAAEMRLRVLEYLKKAYLGDREILEQLLELVSLDEDQLRTRCGQLIESILQEYSAFQVQTIDSFLSHVFRVSALESGFSPAIEITLNNRVILDAAFDQFTQDLSVDPSKRQLLEELTDILVESQNTSSRFIWNPFQKLSVEVRRLYDKMNAHSKDVVQSYENDGKLNTLREEILDTVRHLQKLVQDSGMEMKKHFETAMNVAAAGDIDNLITRKSLFNLPVKKSGDDKSNSKAEEWIQRFSSVQESLRQLVSRYVVQQARNYYRPYIEAHWLFKGTIEYIMRRNGQITLADIYRILLKGISEENVPQVFFYLGETIYHYLIDEFQDTAPVQWEAMKPLLAEALSKQGSFFLVGDTKQSIYAFRNTDWRIMKNLMGTVVFPSAPPVVKELKMNYRSYERILEFNKKVFHEIVPGVLDGKAPHESGLSGFKQEVKESNRKKGYVEVVSYKKDDEGKPERSKILEIVADCKTRGYKYGEMMILTPKNEHVIAVSGWLNEVRIPFISHSSLDVRGRTITGDIIALLRFLDSPIDNLAFTTFLLSDVFCRILAADSIRLTKEELCSFIVCERDTNRSSVLYTLFRKRFADIWKRYFDELFTVVGYLPIYDLVSDIYKRFRLFELAPEEEGSLVKLLEVIKNFEVSGQNNLKDFLSYAEEGEEEADWNISVPGANAVSVMTIHKAKGLDRRVVIVLLVDSKRTTDNLFVEEDEEGVRLVRITQDSAGYSDKLNGLYEQRQLERSVDDLNKLYVAFTRAKEEMYIISLKTDRADEPSRFLPLTGYEPSAKPKVERHEEVHELTAPLHHSSIRPVESNVSPGKLALYERRRGEAIHYILSQVEFTGADIQERISSAVNETAGSWMEDEEAAQIESLIMEFLRLPDIAPYFTPAEGRKILNEQEFVNPDGHLFRMDRIVVDAKSVTVIDFKTGDDKDTYTAQVRDYADILKNMYPDKTVHGILAFVDRKKKRVIV